MMKLLTMAAMVLAPISIVSTPASAQRYTQEELDAAYELCYNTYLDRGFPEGQAYQDCYNRVYGNEGGGGGGGPSGPQPPQRDCYGSDRPNFCNPYEQPN